MDYEQKDALDRARNLHKDAIDMGAKDVIKICEIIFPELAESEDERIKRNIIAALKGEGYFDCDLTNECIAWVKKQKDINSKEYVFRPLAGCDINTAAIQAVEQQKLGNEVVLAFNGAYIPVEEKTADDIVNEYWSWREKQGSPILSNSSNIGKNKQDSADNVEPKFHGGDWIVWQNKCYKVNYNGCGYELIDQNGLSTSLEYETVDTSAHLWDITKDAKNGDVLANGTIVLIVDHLGTFENTPIIYSWYFADSKKFYGMGTSKPDRWEAKGFTPATKEQRDTLIKAMNDAGYTFDFEKKELKKIENRRPLLSDFFSAEYERGKEDALKCIKWNAEDDVKLQRIIDFLWYNRKGDTDTIYQQEQDIDWLKSLKERYAWKPDDEQMEALEHFVRSIGESGYTSTYDNNTKLLYSLLFDLKKLKE